MLKIYIQIMSVRQSSFNSTLDHSSNFALLWTIKQTPITYLKKPNFSIGICSVGKRCHYVHMPTFSWYDQAFIIITLENGKDDTIINKHSMHLNSSAVTVLLSLPGPLCFIMTAWQSSYYTETREWCYICGPLPRQPIMLALNNEQEHYVLGWAQEH